MNGKVLSSIRVKYYQNHLKYSRVTKKNLSLHISHQGSQRVKDRMIAEK